MSESEGHWSVITKAWPAMKRLTVHIACLAIGIIGTSLLYEKLIIAGKDATIQALEVKLGSRPDDSSRVKEWKPLTDDQVLEWANALASYDLTSLEFDWGPHGLDALSFYGSLQKVGVKIGCKVITQEAWSTDGCIDIQAEKDSPALQTIAGLFRGLAPVKISMEQNPNNKLHSIIVYMPEIQ
jgi:hypothetical protein